MFSFSQIGAAAKRRVWMLPGALVLALFVLPLLYLGMAAFDTPRALFMHVMATTLPDQLKATTMLLTLAALLSAVWGVNSALLLTLTPLGRVRWLCALPLLPLALPGYVAAYVYGAVFPGASWLFSLFGAALVLSFVLYPYVFLLVRAALLRDAGRLLEAAQCLGAGAGQVLRRVVLPLVRSGLLAGMLLVMMEVAAEYGAVSYLGVPTLAVGIFRAWYGYQSLALAAVLALILVVVAFGLRGLEQRLYGAQQAAAGGGAHGGLRLALPRWLLALCGVLAVVPFVGGFVLPVAALLQLSLLGQSEPGMGLAALHSVVLALLGAGIITALALLVQGMGRLSQSRVYAVAMSAGRLGYALPGGVVAMMALALLPREALLSGGVTAVLLAYIWRFSAVAGDAIGSQYQQIRGTLDAAGQTLGAGRWRLFRRVHLPLLRPGIGAAAALVFLDVLKELPATLALRPVGFDTAAIQLYQVAADERLMDAAPLALLLIGAGLLSVALLLWLEQRAERNQSRAGR